ncbi:MAG: hypothetical protein KGZ30_03260 [Anaplasmataceae bacterium]|nr:hypothetical protein [Anaplasmataceae bacterium]
MVKIGFLDPANSRPRATLNLAEEEIDCTLDEYIEAVKRIHTSNRHNDWIYLGMFPTKGGAAALTQMDSSTPAGPIRMLQLILVRDKTAYILTMSASKKQFSQFLTAFKKTFSSLCLIEDLYAEISDTEKRSHLIELKNSALTGDENAWEHFQNTVLHQYTQPGTYWQLLVLTEAIKERSSIQASILNTPETPALPINSTEVSTTQESSSAESSNKSLSSATVDDLQDSAEHPSLDQESPQP